MRLLPIDDRVALSRPAPPTIVDCPECGGTAFAERNGDWVCVAHMQHPLSKRPFMVKTCDARGVTLPDGALATSQGRVRVVVAREKPRQTKAERRARIRRDREERQAA